MSKAEASNPNQEKQLSLLGHLAELRTRLVRSVIAVAITTGVAFIFYHQIFNILTQPAGQMEFIYIELTEMIGAVFRVCLSCGIIAAIPYLTYEVIMFVSPGLTAKERKYVYVVIPWIGLMFAGGVVFGYYILVPPAMKFLINFGSDIATAQIRIGNYISIVTKLLLAIGLVFELPVVTTFLARIGVISGKWMAGKRKWAIVLAFVASAMITPTWDPVNQTLVAAPLIVLYEISIWLAYLFGKRKQTENK
jgi:sec-independent protein translocase protein TatC